MRRLYHRTGSSPPFQFLRFPRPEYSTFVRVAVKCHLLPNLPYAAHTIPALTPSPSRATFPFQLLPRPRILTLGTSPQGLWESVFIDSAEPAEVCGHQNDPVESVTICVHLWPSQRPRRVCGHHKEDPP